MILQNVLYHITSYPAKALPKPHGPMGWHRSVSVDLSQTPAYAVRSWIRD